MQHYLKFSLNKAKEKIKEADYLAVIGCGFTEPDKHITKPLLDYFNKAKGNGKKGMIIGFGKSPDEVINNDLEDKFYKNRGTVEHLPEMVKEILALAKDS